MAQPIAVTIEAGDLPEAQLFRIAQNESTDWLEVEPSHGTLRSGERVSLIVRVSNHIAKHETATVGAFLVRLESGLSIPVTAYADVREHDLNILAEAESMPGADAFQLGSDPQASGGKFLEFRAPENSDSNRGLILNAEIPAAGWYSIYVRVRCPPPAGQHDSLYVRVGDGPQQQVSLNVSTDGWHWATQTDGRRLGIQLEQGPYRLTFTPRESMSLDAVQLRGTQIPLAERGGTP
jgi:hypothetical protein